MMQPSESWSRKWKSSRIVASWFASNTSRNAAEDWRGWRVALLCEGRPNPIIAASERRKRGGKELKVGSAFLSPPRRATRIGVTRMDVVGQLGGYALGEVLSSLELDQETIQNAKRGLGVEAAAFSRDSIYNGKFVDEDEEPYDPVTDLEAQVDREMINEQFTQNHSTAATLLRGEEDDFDDDDEDDHAAPTIKQEEEPAKYRFESVEPIAPLPPIRQVPVKDLFPSFEYNQVLTFTDLFTARPRKKPKILHNQIAFSLPSTDELPRAKSTRDVLLASLRPTVKHSRLRSLLIESTDGTREDWQDEGDSHDQLVKAIQVCTFALQSVRSLTTTTPGKQQQRQESVENPRNFQRIRDGRARRLGG